MPPASCQVGEPISDFLREILRFRRPGPSERQNRSAAAAGEPGGTPGQLISQLRAQVHGHSRGRGSRVGVRSRFAGLGLTPARHRRTSTTSSVRGPCTPRIRVISISAVADGPEIVVTSAGPGCRHARKPSGTVSHDLTGPHHAEVVVGDQRQRPAALPRGVAQDDRAGRSRSPASSRSARRRCDRDRVGRAVVAARTRTPGGSQSRVDVRRARPAGSCRAPRARPRWSAAASPARAAVARPPGSAGADRRTARGSASAIERAGAAGSPRRSRVVRPARLAALAQDVAESRPRMRPRAPAPRWRSCAGAPRAAHHCAERLRAASPADRGSAVQAGQRARRAALT